MASSHRLMAGSSNHTLLRCVWRAGHWSLGSQTFSFLPIQKICGRSSKL